MFAKIINAVKSLFTAKNEVKTESVKKVVTSEVIDRAVGDCEVIELIANVADGKILGYYIRTVGKYTKSGVTVMRADAYRAHAYFNQMKNIYQAA